MIISRVVSLFLRFGQFVCAAVCLGISAHFLHEYYESEPHTGPNGREIYTIIIAALSLLMSLVWLIPFTSTFFHYPFDFLLSLAWFAAFGVLVNWVHRANCGGAFHWGGITHNNYCSKWKANEAFAFISACFWLASAILVRLEQTRPSYNLRIF
ncbi:uncharacterized protein K452DRAFT_225060 [Aplosporella prunicola CBS 121167]|uniref:MARVEL domain-containing protein n=1 Tax=Aplosporella prunicola CBS 121167 TaxID=1176127 RepID=A0A6A6BGP0_9PEZI|nr:uncharacterized protein K452DRAFT_225060 [Aplosporella prunicola CBS 121167]KAF2143309.1 hypothetical protein K452DRAFT_225060 [Aplosporella prunicola CBS 121167]